MFASQYLKMSLIFKLAFTTHSSEVHEKLRNRECLMTSLHCVAYLSFFICFFAMLRTESHTVTSLVYTIGTFAISISLTYSMAKINNFAKMVSGVGITTSKPLLVIHLTAFWIVSVLQAIVLLVTTNIQPHVYNDRRNNTLILT